MMDKGIKISEEDKKKIAEFEANNPFDTSHANFIKELQNKEETKND